MPPAAVDGNMLLWYRNPEHPRKAEDEDPGEYPRMGTLVGWPAGAPCNDPALDYEPDADEQVFIGGYFCDSNQAELPAYWKTPASIVDGRVVDSGSVRASTARDGIIWLSVPSGDYTFFRGGPVARRMPDCKFGIFAVVLFQVADETPPDGQTILGAQSVRAGRAAAGP